jgi:hypothetical protein
MRFKRESEMLVAGAIRPRLLSNTAGEVTAIRFWKDANETGTHTGRLWTAAGALLASVTFQNESSTRRAGR